MKQISSLAGKKVCMVQKVKTAALENEAENSAMAIPIHLLGRQKFADLNLA